MAYRNSVDSTGTLFFTKYSDPNALDQKERNRFRSTFQASRIGDQRKMDEIQIMFNNYTLFKYGQVASSVGKKRNSISNIPVPETEVNPNKYKNKKERMKDSEHLKQRLENMRSQRQQLFEKLSEITSKNPRKFQ